MNAVKFLIHMLNRVEILLILPISIRKELRKNILGEFIASDRDRFVLATKYTSNIRRGDPNAGGNHRKQLSSILRCKS